MNLTGYDVAAEIVGEDPSGEPLDRLLTDGPLELVAALQIARQLAGALATLHHRGFIHRAIRPSNVLVDPSSGETALLGLELASRVPRERREPDVSGLALAYISPEQTGRTNRLVDYRTDLYSLGVTLFEMSTGRLPFPAGDPLELIHAHIAKRPPSPSAIDPAIPDAVSDIVAKLLAKTAEDRYQGGRGLRHDLERCLRELGSGGEVPSFALGERDVPARFELPQELIGREAEIERLRAALDAASRGEVRAHVVTGYSGVGKTALLGELRRHVLLEGGTFVSGKYNSLERGTPYSAILAALRDLVRPVLFEEPERAAFNRRRLAAALGPNLGVLTEVVPELETLVGKPPPVETLEPAQAKNRFHLCVGRFLGVFTSQDRPLVLFLDDLQWIDPSSLDLLKSALDPGLGRFLLLGAYRDNEVDTGHPLLEALAEIRAKGVGVETSKLQPLGPEDVERLVASALRAESGLVAELAELVYRKTAGNPFFVKAFLASLHEEGRLSFDPESGWSWDLTRIAEMEATENVIELTARKIARLPDATRRTTALAAALGSRFEVATLAAVCELSIEETESHLIAACRERILVKQDHGYQFEHDGLRESAYSFIADDAGAETHLHIGRLLIERQGPSADRQIFEIVKHLDRAAPLLVSPAEREEAARLNLVAGSQARAAAAFPAALQYFTRGLSLLGPQAWSRCYDLSLGLHNKAAEAAVLAADFPAADRLVAIVMEHARDLLDKVPAYESRISAAYARLREEEALDTCREVLALLGVEIPAASRTREIDAAFRDAHLRVEPMLSMDPGELRVMTDPARLAASHILIRTALIAGRADPVLGRLAACKLLELAVEHGHCANSAFGYVLIGDICCNVLRDLDGGYRAGAFGLALLERLGDRRMWPICQGFFDALIRPWKIPPAVLCESNLASYQRALEVGDLYTAGGSAYHLCINQLLAGRELAEVETTIRQYHGELSRRGRQMYALTLRRLLHVVLELKGGTHAAPEPGADEAASRRRGADLNIEVRVAGFEMMLRHLLRDRRAALEMALDSEALPENTLPGIPVDFYRCLIFLDRHPDEDRRTALLSKVDTCREKLAERAAVEPVSYRHKLDLVDAERQRVLGRPAAAMGLYETAIEGARRHGFVQEEALAAELAAEFYLELGAGRAASFYLEEAAAAYGRWGARAKVAELGERYPEQLSGLSRPQALPAALAPAAGDSGALDMMSLERAMGALAGELDLRELLDRLIAILLQNAGAQRGYLLRTVDGQIFVEASGSVDEDEPRCLDVALEACEGLAHSIVRYVSRFLERVVLGDASRDERFASDPYVVSEQPKSVFCAPILHQGKPAALLYLENNRTRDAFVEDRLAAVQLISSQAAAVLENARLHHDLKQEVTVRQAAERDLRRALAEMGRLKDRLEAENVYLREEIRGVHELEEIVGGSDVLMKALGQVEQVAATDATVLVLGETGTGKELVARAVHSRSPRGHRPLVRVNCATLPDSLIESELFGHEKGAFTGAFSAKIGRFELADGGTIFLDEIGDLAPDLQAKLLRVLQEGEFERLGSTKTRRVDVRVIAATHLDLERSMAEGTFRADLFYRLTVFPIALPPLRDRLEDIPLLVWHFVKKKQERLGKSIREIPRHVMDALVAHTWPGNVRELENTIERAVILSPGPTLRLEEHFAGTSFARAVPTRPQSLEENERGHILRILEGCGWKVKGRGNAADRLGLNPSTLRFRMKKLGIERPDGPLA